MVYLKAKEERGEPAMDLAGSCHHHLPGKTSEYIMIGRNLQQWRDSIDYHIMMGGEDPAVTSGGTTGSTGSSSTPKTKPKSKLSLSTINNDIDSIT